MASGTDDDWHRGRRRIFISTRCSLSIRSWFVCVSSKGTRRRVDRDDGAASHYTAGLATVEAVRCDAVRHDSVAASLWRNRSWVNWYFLSNALVTNSMVVNSSSSGREFNWDFKRKKIWTSAASCYANRVQAEGASKPASWALHSRMGCFESRPISAPSLINKMGELIENRCQDPRSEPDRMHSTLVQCSIEAI